MLVEIYYEIDEFCKENEQLICQCLYQSGHQRLRPCKLSLSEMMTIIVYHQLMYYRNFKRYYQEHVMATLKTDFPDLISYERFSQNISKCLLPLCLFMRYQCQKSLTTGIYYIDSFPIKSCHPKRAHQHKTMRGLADWGKTSTGWFYGLKGHLVVNQYGQPMNFLLTSASMADNDVKVLFHLSKDLEGFLFGDRGYLLNHDKRVFLERDGKLFVVSKDRKNMKKKDIPLQAKLYLKKRGIIESVINQHKNVLDIEHTRHRSPFNALTNMIAAMVAYTFMERKPKTAINIAQYAIEQPDNENLNMAA